MWAPGGFGIVFLCLVSWCLVATAERNPFPINIYGNDTVCEANLSFFIVHPPKFSGYNGPVVFHFFFFAIMATFFVVCFLKHYIKKRGN